MRIITQPKITLCTLVMAGCLSVFNQWHAVIVTAFSPSSLPFTHTRQQRKKTELFVLQEKITAEEINSRLQSQLAKLREKDRASKELSPEDLDIVHEDDDIIVINKPAGVLCVPSAEGVPSLAQTVFEKCLSSRTLRLAKYDQMVVHRLGMDTSGLVVFAKSIQAVRGMNVLFRTRKITRQYECLVAGHVAKDQGLINLPLMRDYEHPPFMRVSTDEHQAALLDLDPAVVGKKLLEAPKDSLTHYQVVSRESLNDDDNLPVSRLALTSITGRTHQLNVHCAAFGHPIVGDTTYGYQGDAAPDGGLDETALAELAPDRASNALQKAIAAASARLNVCVHAKSIKFRHPVTSEEVEFTSTPPF